MMTLEIDQKQLDYATKMLSGLRGGVQRATARSINRAVTAARTEASKKAREQYMVKAAAVKNSFKVSKAVVSSDNIHGFLRSTGRPILIKDFVAVNGKHGVKAKVLRGSNLKFIAKSFIATTRHGFTLPIQRKSTKAYPLKALYGPAVPQMLKKQDNAEAIINRAKEVFTERMDHEILAILDGHK